MREFKFRAWDKKSKEMISYGKLFRLDTSNEMPFLPLLEKFMDKYFVMQFTGLKDSTTWQQLTEAERTKWTRDGNMPSGWKGKEIYEDDILQYKNGDKALYTIVWKDGGFHRRYKFMRKYQGEGREETTDLPIYPDSHIVIGNIHENAELLGGDGL